MIETPQIVQTDARSTAVIHLIVPRAEIQSVMGPGLAEVRAAVASQGIEPIGPWFTHHLNRPTDVFDFEVGVPVAAAVTATGRVRPSRLPAARVARTIYRGPYEGLGDAWGELMAWIAANGLTPAPDLWECYRTGPESGPDPAGWTTELNRPLLDPA